MPTFSSPLPPPSPTHSHTHLEILMCSIYCCTLISLVQYTPSSSTMSMVTPHNYINSTYFSEKKVCDTVLGLAQAVDTRPASKRPAIYKRVRSPLLYCSTRTTKHLFTLALKVADTLFMSQNIKICFIAKTSILRHTLQYYDAQIFHFSMLKLKPLKIHYYVGI